MKPIVLLATTCRWVPVARLAMSLRDAGFCVEVICPANHPISRTGTVTRTFAYRGLAPLDSFAEAINSTDPHLIIPGDDLAAEQLHALYDREHSKSNIAICSVLERSLGAPTSYRALHERSTFMEIAGEEGIRVPKTAVIKSVDELQGWETGIGFPLVLKANGTSGGHGVRIVRSREEAIAAWHTLQAPPSLARAIKRALVDNDRSLIWPSLRRHHPQVNVQSFIEGREATSLVACSNGKVLAGLHFEVLNKGMSSGPASVLRVIENAEMLRAAEKMVGRLNLSGLHGFDFMLETNTNDAYLIEINPRSTQVGHLALGAGRDLSAALYSAVTGKEIHEAPKVTENNIIALFPQEWFRDSGSAYLKSAFHDVPWTEPELVRTCITKSRKWIINKSQRERINAFWRLADSRYQDPHDVSPTNALLAEHGRSRDLR